MSCGLGFNHGFRTGSLAPGLPIAALIVRSSPDNLLERAAAGEATALLVAPLHLLSQDIVRLTQCVMRRPRASKRWLWT